MPEPHRAVRLVLALLLVALVVPPQPARAAVLRQPLVVAERGGSAAAREDTLTAVAQALSLGVDEVEVDVQRTLDGQLVVLHDSTLDRTTSCTGPVASRTLAEVERCDAARWFTPGVGSSVHDDAARHPLRGHGIVVPALAQVAALLRGTPVRLVVAGAGDLPSADTRLLLRQAVAQGLPVLRTAWPACALDVEGRRTEQAGDCARDLARPTAGQCASVAPRRTAPATGTSRAGDLRVIGVQYHQQVSNVVSYDTFRTAVACLFETYVVPHEVRGRPTLVVLDEDIGLMTIATGARGATARAVLQSPAGGGAGDSAPAPAGALAALAQLNATYAPQVAAYQASLGPVAATKQVFVAATDTFARVFSQTFSDAARDYGVWVVASNNQPTYRESFDPADEALYRDPEVTSGPAYVATSQVVPNTTFLWGPRDVHPHAPDGETNLLFRNAKVPLTPFEADDLMLDEGPTSGAASRANAAGWVVAGHRLGFATSFPAFQYGNALGTPPPADDPCDHALTEYARCMDREGVDTVVQAEANDGRWAADAGSGAWQPLEWMSSAWRAVSDPTVHFRYAVNPFMTGNLADLPFDGQSAILARADPDTFAAHYVGAGRLEGTDPAADRVYAGQRPGFLALAPWVRPDASRATLANESAALAPGSGSAEEDDYLQTAVFADLLPSRHAASAPVPRRTPHAAPLPTPSLPTTGGLPAAALGLGVLVLTTAAVLRRR